MLNYKWIHFGLAPSRLELFGSTEETEAGGDNPIGQLQSISAIRIFNQEEDEDNDGSVNQIDLEEIELEFPILFNPGDQTVSHLGTDELILEGFEGPEDRFMDMIDVTGWKLILRQQEDTIAFEWYLLSDWQIDSHPDYFPGDTLGEISITGTSDNSEEDMAVEIPWPMAVDGRLNLGVPRRKGDRWRATVDPEKILSVFDGAGALLKDFPLGSLDLSSVKNAVGDLVQGYKDFINLETGIDSFGRVFFDLIIGPPDEIDIAEFGGLKLALLGDAAIILSSVFEDDHLELSLRLYLSNQAGLKLHGPFIRKAEDALGEAKEVMAMLPIENGIEVPDFPDLQINFELGNEPIDKALVSANLPLRWDYIPGLNPITNFFSDLPLNIDPSQLVGFKFGSLDGDAPKVEMKIAKAEFYNQDAVYGVDFEIELNVKIDSGEPIPFVADWLFTLDTDTMSFNPAASLKLRTEYKEFTVAGLTVTGLDNLLVSFEAGNLSFSASRLQAYYGGITEGDDRGFEMEVTDLLIDGGGLDMELFLKGGVTKVAGIGESFKGAEGQVVFKRSKFQSGYIKAEGPLPWMDNATGSIALAFGQGFKLDRVQADFQLGLHHKSDWWVELELQSVNIDIRFDGDKPNLILMVTGSIGIVPPEGSGGNFILQHLKSANLEFKDLVLTKSFDKLPPGIKLSVVLAKPVSIDLLGVFGFEMRSIGIGSGFGDGQAAITIGGQVFFSSNDLQNKDPEFHKFKIGNPKPGEQLPQLAFENLALEFSYKPTLAISGAVDFKDTPEWKGFKGHGKLTINKTININVILEFATVLREEDNRKLRVWMVYAEWMDIDANLIDKFYLRDLGVGFGWRKTLHVMDNPNLVLENPSSNTMTIGPHLPSSWADDLEGDKAKWTLVLSSWLTYGLKGRSEATPLVGDILLGVRSDLTILISMRGWIFGVLDEVKKGSGGLRPSIVGLMYYSARNRHLLAAYIVDPSASTPKGVPPALVKALIKNPFSFVLETKPGLFRLELGWPRQLSFPLGAYTGRAGFLMRSTSRSLTVGVGFEIAIDHEYSWGISFGIGSIGIYIKIYIGIYGMILARIGHRAALYGIVGINAVIIIAIRLSVNFKIGWIRIKFSIGQSLTLIITARVDFGISDAGFGMEGYATASLRIWKFSFGAQVSFALNRPALYEARDRVFEGVTMAGNEEENTIRFLPEPLFLLPPIKKQIPRWRAMPVRKEGFIYLLLLPEEDSWFSCPDINQNGTYKKASDPNYVSTFDLKNIDLVEHADSAQTSQTGSRLTVNVTMPWNQEVTIVSEQDQENDERFKLGNLYYEPKTVQTEHQLLDQLLEDPYLQPELMTDWRVRTEEGASDGMNDDLETRPDVRSPKFSTDGSLYDLALEEAFKSGEKDLFSWQSLAVAQTRWTSDVASKPEVMEYMLGQGYELPPADGDEQEIYDRRKKLLHGLEDIRSIRSGLSGTLIREFKKLVNGDVPLEELEVLKTSGLAYKFKILDEDDFSLEVNSLKIDRGYGKSQSVKKDQIESGSIDSENFGIGFERENRNYRLQNLLEFQDQEGIHFSWELECETEEGDQVIMTERESSGLQEENKFFEFFDYYLVERINLSSESQETNYAKWEAKPGYVPAWVDIGDGNRNFYLVVPRFDFSDMFETPASVGDQLIYRFTAIDIFGNPSQTLEYLTTRKHLEAPPAPDKAVADYSIELSKDGIENEQLAVTVTPSQDMANWEGSSVTYELWTQSKPLSTGGYFGLGDDVEDIGDEGEDPILAPKGMRLVGRTPDVAKPFTVDEIGLFGYGQVHTLFVRTITKEGNASRLIRCQHTLRINALPIKPQAYLERVPPAMPQVTEWLNPTDLRSEVLPNTEPVLNDSSLAFKSGSTSEKLLRELSISLSHSNHVDDDFLYPTGGYEIFVRDRDITTSDDFAHYKRQAAVEVLSPGSYRISPYNTEDYSKWRSNFVVAESPINNDGYAHWGEPLLLDTTHRIEGFPESLLIHGELEDLLYSLQTWAEENQGYLVIHGGGVSKKDVQEISFDDLSTRFDLEKDPNGMGLLSWMGRTVDFGLYQNGKLLEGAQLIEVLKSTIRFTNDYQPVLELLLNSDRQTPMAYYRLGLHPFVKALSTDEDPEIRKTEREGQFADSMEGFIEILRSMNGKTPIGFDRAGILDKYKAFISRFADTRGLSYESTLMSGVSWFVEQGDISRTVNEDDTISIQQIVEEPLARRYAYRIKRIGRYFPLYRQLGLVDELQTVPESKPLLLRLPRVAPPRVPTIEFLGNHLRDKVQCTEWLMREHDEEAATQSNETLRNRLGFRGLAWSLYTEVLHGWRTWSGWEGDDNWFNHAFDAREEEMRLSEAEVAVLQSDPKWKGDSLSKPDAGLRGHPFTELLEPKGMIVRVPELPHYYEYRLAAFARADDLDSKAKLSDKVKSLPGLIPTLDEKTSGWAIADDGKIDIWWKVPPVWESMNKTQRTIWQNEAPFAKRLWDWDLKYTVQMSRQGVTIPLLYLKAQHPESDIPKNRPFVATTSGSYLFDQKEGKVEKLAPIHLYSKYNPELKLRLSVSDKLLKWMSIEDFAFEVVCSRSYGPNRSSQSFLTNKTPVEV